MDIEARITRLEDRAAINDLVVRYFLAADGDDLAGVADSFTEDAIFSSSGVKGGEGRDGIVAFIGAARQQMGLTIHTPNYVQVTFDGPGHARGLVGAHLELVIGGTAVYGAVRYVDSYIRQGDVWRISNRDMRTIHMAPWLSVGEAFASKEPVRWPGAPAGPSDFPRAR
jgi:uncharacterized protein (TIGR02246 family)